MVQLSRYSLQTVVLPVTIGVLGISLAACSSPPKGASSSMPSTAVASVPQPTSSSSDPAVTVHGKIMEGFPEVIEPLPEATIVSSSLNPHAAEEGTKENVDPLASLVMRTSDGEKKIIQFYTKSLKDKGFEPLGDPTKVDNVWTQAFYNKKDKTTISVAIGSDPDNKGKKLVTVGGNVAH